MKSVLDGIVGAASGILSGFGVGGGTLLVLYLTLFTKTAQRTAQGINLLYFLPTAGAALVGHIKNRMIEKRAFLWAGGCGVVTTAVSAILIGKLPTGFLRRGFGAFLIIIGIIELVSKKPVEAKRELGYNENNQKRRR